MLALPPAYSKLQDAVFTRWRAQLNMRQQHISHQTHRYVHAIAPLPHHRRNYCKIYQPYCDTIPVVGASIFNTCLCNYISASLQIFHHDYAYILYTQVLL